MKLLCRIMWICSSWPRCQEKMWQGMLIGLTSTATQHKEKPVYANIHADTRTRHTQPTQPTHTEAVTYRSFYTQTLYTPKLLHTEAFTRGTSESQFYLNVWDSNIISGEGVAISWCLVGTERGLKREKKKERDRDQGQEGKREKEREREKGREIRCEDENMWRWEHVKIGRCMADLHY